MTATTIPIIQPAAADSASFANLLTTDASKPEDLEILLERFLSAIIALAGAQAGAMRVLTDDDKFLRLVAHQGLPPDVVQNERLVDRQCGVCGRASSADVLIWVDDLTACDKQGLKLYFGSRCKSMLAISLLHNQQILGIYNLFFESSCRIDASVQTLLRLLGQLLGLTLHNARIERERLRLTVMKERQDMVNEVHDALAQTLAYARMRLPLLNDAIVAHDETQALKYFSNLKTAVTEVHDNLREVMTYFRTRMDPLGLMHALTTIADSFYLRNAITLEIRNTVPNLNLNDHQEVQVFYIIQEALANIAKHSMARHAQVRISQTSEYLEFLIEDDGLGMDEPNVSTIITSARPLVPSTHFGMDIMQSRAKRLGGRLEVGNMDGIGTRVRLSIPIETERRSKAS
ncbi:ATP-binding protein [Rhodoferax sp.]|uniref:GAF domain-containing sensor histidine kinase n=1 Tax=Rhodoferax sp. TaxID=50421 RepID=UPI0019FC6907|nr:ATP-binding protein [Rhodoferax sp.]MBE0472595.1 GAF domain-containing protein [Rhodoferax sp.]